jgi:hypothetical protein
MVKNPKRILLIGGIITAVLISLSLGIYGFQSTLDIGQPDFGCEGIGYAEIHFYDPYLLESADVIEDAELNGTYNLVNYETNNEYFLQGCETGDIIHITEKSWMAFNGSSLDDDPGWDYYGNVYPICPSETSAIAEDYPIWLPLFRRVDNADVALKIEAMNNSIGNMISGDYDESDISDLIDTIVEFSITKNDEIGYVGYQFWKPEIELDPESMLYLNGEGLMIAFKGDGVNAPFENLSIIESSVYFDEEYGWQTSFNFVVNIDDYSIVLITPLFGYPSTVNQARYRFTLNSDTITQVILYDGEIINYNSGSHIFDTINEV